MKALDPSRFTKADIGLLMLCKNNPGPNILEMFDFAMLYELEEDSIRPSYIKLLCEKMVQPYGSIHKDHYLPVSCLVTDRGLNLLQLIEAQKQYNLPNEELQDEWLTRQIQHEGHASIRWSTINEIDSSEILKLADLYTDVAHKRYEENQSHESIELFFAAAIGYSKINDILRMQSTLKECFRLIEETQEIIKLLEYLMKSQKEIGHESEALSVIQVPFQNLFSDMLDGQVPQFKDFEMVQEIRTKIYSNAKAVGKLYDISLPGKPVFPKYVNAIDDLISEAFNIHNKIVFHSAINLLEGLVTQADQMVKTNKNAIAEWDNISFSKRVSLASRTCDVSHLLADLVFINDEHKDNALQLVKQLVEIIVLLTVQPISNISHYQPGDDRNIMWAFQLLTWKPDKAKNAIYSLATEAKRLLKNQTINKASLSPELEKILTELKTVKDGMGATAQKMQIARGQLTEYAVIQYFKSMDIPAEKASAEYDHKKIDVLAEDDTHQYLVQVKSGKIGTKEIRRIAENVSSISRDIKKQVVMVVVAEQFPPSSEFIRQEIENSLGLQILFIHKYQIVDMQPEFSRTIE